jgi:transposase
MSQADRPARSSRRRFTAAFKAAVVQEYDAADGPGARGAILRREGLYDSHVQKWRKAVEEGRLRDTPVAGLTPSRDRSRQAQLAPVFHDGADDGIAAWGESMTVRGYDVGPAGAAGLRFSGS